MGCGKSKHDVASGNTVLQRKKSSVNSKENEAQTVEKNNDVNVDNVSSEVEEKNKENVKEVGVEGKGNESNDVAEITKVQEDEAILEKSAEAEAEENKAREIVVAQGPNEESECGKDESLEQKEQDVKDVVAAEEKQPTEENKDEKEKEDVNLREETLVKEEESKDTNEEALVKEEESKDTKEETLAKEEETKEGETEKANVSTSTS